MPDLTPRRLFILRALSARVAVITVDNGFATDIGKAVYLGEGVELGDDDPAQVVAVVPGEDSTPFTGENVLVKWPVTIQALVKVSLDDPTAAIEMALGDIKRAVELDDRTLGGLLTRGQRLTRGATRTVFRQPGSTTAGVGITYLAPFLEQWGNP
jgi:hypothetical protein